MEMLKIYVSGPITGIPEANRQEFEDAAKMVQAAGAWPLIPHDIDPDHLGRCIPDGKREASGHTYPCHLRADVLVMLTCDAVLMLPGWEQSHGARQEHNIAAVCGVPIHYMGDFGSMRTSQGSHLFEAVREANGENIGASAVWGPWGPKGRAGV